MNRVLYIASAPRSGSTLLDNLLGGHGNVVSVGEVHHLRAYARDDRRLYDPAHPLLCSCGARVVECPFWCAVERALGVPLDSMTLKPLTLPGARGASHPAVKPIQHLASSVVRRWPSLYRQRLVHSLMQGNRIGRDSWRLFDAVASVSGASWIVDSSKSPHRFWSLHTRAPDRVCLAVLCRDYRAVAHSAAKRGACPRDTVKRWVQTLRGIDAFSSNMSPERVIRIRYEDLCARPEATLELLCAFMGIPFDSRMLRRSLTNAHHLGGSPSKFAEDRRTIVLDTQHEGAFDGEEMARLQRLAGTTARRWGYT